jgi:hypothetical protein
MKQILIFGTLLLGCCLAIAQMGSSPNQDQQGAAPQAYPQVQTPSEQANPANQPALPPDSSAPVQAQEQAADSANQTASSQIVTVQGCLSQSASSFMLADNLGNNYQLTGNESKLAKLVGKEIQVSGTATSNAVSLPGAMSSDTADTAASASPGAFAQISVSNARKIANVCPGGTATGSSAIGE